jgi:hypothetical protein
MTPSSRPNRTLPCCRCASACTALLLCATAISGVAGCQSRKSATSPQPQPAPSARSIVAPPMPLTEQTMLTGSFERVSRAASGTANIVRHGNDYELRLNGVSVATEGVVHVYLVGHDDASSTRIVTETEMKYDMAELLRGVPEQRIALPSEPSPLLRSVVLFNPAFGVNLAVARLRPTSKAPESALH